MALGHRFPTARRPSRPHTNFFSIVCSPTFWILRLPARNQDQNQVTPRPAGVASRRDPRIHHPALPQRELRPHRRCWGGPCPARSLHLVDGCTLTATAEGNGRRRAGRTVLAEKGDPGKEPTFEMDLGTGSISIARERQGALPQEEERREPKCAMAARQPRSLSVSFPD